MSKPRAASHRSAVLVTGASSGIGRACALTLAAEGFCVVAGVRSMQDAEALKESAQGNLSTLLLDITDANQLAHAASLLSNELRESGLGGLINNAGICVTGPLEYVPIESLRVQLEVNVVAQIAVTQAMLPLLRRGKGRIVNIGSTSGRIAGRYAGPYCASKFALEALTSVLRLELQSSGIAVSIIEPGIVATPFWKKLRAAEDALAQSLPEEGWQRYGAALRGRQQKMMLWGQNGLSTAAVCDSVRHALTTSRPKLRYVVGSDARLRTTLAALLPERLWYYLGTGGSARTD